LRSPSCWSSLNHKLDDTLKKANADVERIDEEYMEFKRYMVENRGEIDPHEMFQNELELNRSQTEYSSLGIITKTSHAAELLYNQLSPDLDVHLLSRNMIGACFILPAYELCTD